MVEGGLFEGLLEMIAKNFWKRLPCRILRTIINGMLIRWRKFMKKSVMEICHPLSLWLSFYRCQYNVDNRRIIYIQYANFCFKIFFWESGCSMLIFPMLLRQNHKDPHDSDYDRSADPGLGTVHRQSMLNGCRTRRRSCPHLLSLLFDIWMDTQ